MVKPLQNFLDLLFEQAGKDQKGKRLAASHGECFIRGEPKSVAQFRLNGHFKTGPQQFFLELVQLPGGRVCYFIFSAYLDQGPAKSRGVPPKRNRCLLIDFHLHISIFSVDGYLAPNQVGPAGFRQSGKSFFITIK